MQSYDEPVTRTAGLEMQIETCSGVLQNNRDRTQLGASDVDAVGSGETWSRLGGGMTVKRSAIHKKCTLTALSSSTEVDIEGELSRHAALPQR